MESVSKSEKMTPSSILSIIAGALMVAGGILALSTFSIWTQAGMPGWGGGMMGGGGWGMMSGGSMWNAVGTTSAISIGAGVISIVGGYSIFKRPESGAKWGTAILASGIIGLVFMGGFFIGPILGIIGGILALTRK